MSVCRKLQHGANLARILILLSLAALGSPVFGEVCDVDSDGDIDRLDLEAIFAARNQPASGTDDPRDEDVNGFITVLDGRACALKCAVAQCVITEPLKAPVLAEVPPQVVAEGETATVPISATDEDGDDLTFSTESLPGFATFTDHTDGSATLELAPGFADAGEYAFLLSVADPTHTVSQTVNISVTNTNRGPELAAVGNYTITETEQLVIPLSATDPDAEPLAFAVTGLPAFGSLADNGDGTAAITLATNYDSAGQYPLTVTVTDPGGSSATAAFQVTVNNINRPPVIVSQPVVSAAEGSPYTYPVTVEDPDEDPLQFSLTEAPAGMGIDPATGLISWTPGPYQDGIRNVQVQVADGQGGSDAQAWQIDVSTTVDRIDPTVTLIAPESAQVGSAITVEAQAHDNVGVERVVIYVDGVQVRESTQPPHSINYNMPPTAGQTLAIRAVAFDAAGNEGEALATVTAVDTPDETPPVIHAVYLSPSAAPSEQVTVRAEVSDDRGIEVVTFSHAGSQFGSASVLAYEAVFPLPADSVPGAELTVVVVATDTTGNTASSQATLTVASEADTTAPEAVAVTAPPGALAGQTISLSASAIDDVGLLKVVFFGDGVVLGEDPEAPFEWEYLIPVEQPIGSQIDFVVRAIDFSGNATDSAPVITEILAPGEGFLVGEVYDDSTGLPVVGARVRLHTVGGREVSEPPETVTDIHGEYGVPAIVGMAVVMIELDSYTRVYRTLEVLPDEVNVPLDVRLTPLNPGTPVTPLAEATIVLDAPVAQLQVPAGAVSEASTLSLTALSGQGLPAPLPVGWAPVVAINAGPEGRALQSPAQLTIAGNQDDLIAARWDAVTQQWLRIPATSADGDWSVPLATLGAVALVRADTQPATPAVPAVGAALTGVAEQAIPAGVAAEILPSPEILFMQPDAYSDVTVLLDNGASLPSGTRIEVDFQEYYERISGTSLWPSPMAQDFTLYQDADGFVSHFVASPSEVFDPSLLREGVISLTAHRPPVADGTAVLGAAGGVVSTTDGLSLSIPAGALQGATPVLINNLTEPDPAFTIDGRFTFLAGAQVELGGKSLAVSAELTVTLATAIAPDAQVLVVRPVEVQGITRYLLAGIAEVSDSTLTFGAGALGLPLPGIRSEGRYYLVQMNEPVGYVSGAVLNEGAPATQTQVATDTLPFVSLTADDQTHYALASLLGETSISGKGLTDGNSATGTVSLAAQNEIAILDLDLQTTRPTVVSVSPADGATGVSIATAITVKFTREMDPGTFTQATFSVSDTASNVEGTVTLLPDKITAVFQPSTPLGSETLHLVSLSAEVRDAFGQSLDGNQPDGSFTTSFTTLDVTPPAKPEAGQVVTSAPDDFGLVTITGSQGTTEPDVVIFAKNGTSGVIASVIAASDGSFQLKLPASIWDNIELSIIDAAGNEQSIDPGPHIIEEGVAYVGFAGGTVHLADGSIFTFAPGSFEEPTRVTIARKQAEDLGVTIPIETGLGFSTGFTLDTDGKELLRPLNFRIPFSDDTITEDTHFLVCQVDEALGEKRLVAVDTAAYKDGYLEISSAPWKGIEGGPFSIVGVFVAPINGFIQLSFVTGHVYKAPPYGALTIEADSAAIPGHPITIRAEAVTVHPLASASEVQIIDPVSGTVLASGDKQAVIQIDLAGVIPAGSVIVTTGEDGSVSHALVEKSIRRWQAKATFHTPGTCDEQGNQVCTIEANTTTEAVENLLDVNPDPRPGVAHLHGRHLEGAISGECDPDNPPPNRVEGAWVETYNGVDPTFPSVAETNACGGFVLAASPGPSFLRVLDPVTGNGQVFRYEIPDTPFDFVRIGGIGIPVAFGDGEPPTLTIQVEGTLLVGEPMTISLVASDDTGIDRYDATVGSTHFGNQEVIDFTPKQVGDLAIAATVWDTAGNWTTRNMLVQIRQPGPATSISLSGTGSIEPDSANLPVDLPIYLALSPGSTAPPTELSDGISLDQLSGVDVYFEDAAGNRIAAGGGTSSGGNYLRIYPARPLPPNSSIKLVAGGTEIPFTTKGLDKGAVLQGDFTDIRGVAISGEFAYVADHGDPEWSIKVVDISDPANPSLTDPGADKRIRFGEIRGIATDLNTLVAIGGGGSTIALPPRLRAYELSSDPGNPSSIHGTTLFPIPEQAVPFNVRVSGNLAYVSTVGPGLQTVDLGTLELMKEFDRSDRQLGQIWGGEAVVGGFQMPNPDYEIGGSSYDSVINFPGLVVTGGLSSELAILSATTAGYLGYINDIAFGPEQTFPLMRLAGIGDFVVRKEDGIYQNLNLVIAAHGSRGLSLLDITDPKDPALLRTVISSDPEWPDGWRVMDMAPVDNFVFTSDRVITIDDPTKPVISEVLNVKDANGNPVNFSSGGDVAISADILKTTGERVVTTVSGSGSRLQVGQITLPEPGPDWGVIRTVGFETVTAPENEWYLYTGDPVSTYTGEFILTETDLAVPGRGLDFAFTRTYRSRNMFDGPIGYGWDHNYNARLTVLPDENVVWHDGTGRFVTFKWEEAENRYKAPVGVFAELERTQASGGYRFSLTLSDGITHTFRSSSSRSTRYLLESASDRYGNTMHFDHDGKDRLHLCRDTMGREFRFSYDARGRLNSVSDYTGRTVAYRYDYDNNLTAMTTPAVEEFPDGKTTRYAYSGGFREYDSDGNLLETRALNHNLLTITDPNGQVYLENVYNTNPADNTRFDRVIEQRLGLEEEDTCQGGSGKPGWFTFDYDETPDGGIVATTTSRTCAVAEFTYDPKGNLLKVEEPANVEGQETTIVTEFEYDDEGRVLRETSPREIKIEYVYDEDNASRLRQADISQVALTPAGGGNPRVTQFERGDWGSLLTIHDPEDDITQFVLSEDGLGSIEEIRYPVGGIVERFTYGANGELISVTGGDGVVRFNEYYTTDDGRAGYLRAMVEDSSSGGKGAPRMVEGGALNLSTRFTYDAVGNILSITDPRDNQTDYVVNELNQNRSISDGRGSKIFFYDANDNLATVNDLGGRDTEYQYNSLDRVTALTERGAGSRTNSYEYDANEHVARVASPLAHEVVTTRDARGLALEVRTEGGVDAVAGMLNRFTYDEDGNVTGTTDGEGHTTTFTYNGFNELAVVMDPNGSRVEYDYNSRGDTTAQRWYDESGSLVRQQIFEVDPMGRTRVIRETILGGLAADDSSTVIAETHFEYDPAGRVIAVTDALGRTLTRSYDGAGRLVTETDPAGNRRTMIYEGLDPKALVVIDKQPGGGEVETTMAFVYDQYGRLESQSWADGTAESRVQQFFYDERDNLLRTEVVGGSTGERTYDAFNRLTSINTGRELEEYTYDAEDNITRNQDAQGHGISMRYDGRGRLKQATYEDASMESYTYLFNNQLNTYTDRAGNLYDYDYDAAGRLTKRVVQATDDFNPVPVETVQYDALDRPIEVVLGEGDAAEIIRYSYNSRGDVLRESLVQGGNIDATFELAGSRIGLVYPTGKAFVTARDVLGRVERISFAGGSEETLASFRFAGPDTYASATYGNGVQAEATYNTAREPAKRTYRSSEGVAQTEFDYSYDDSGRLAGVTIDYLKPDGWGVVESEFYAYSGESWLQSVDHEHQDIQPVDDQSGEPAPDPVTVSTVYDYDTSGNRILQSRGGQALNFTPNSLNQYTAVGEASLEYDVNGNLRKGQRFTFEYDPYGRLTNVIDPLTATAIATYEYDAMGRRARATTSSGVEEYRYDGNRIVAVIGGGGQLQREYIYAPWGMGPLLMRRQGEMFYYQYDHRGSVIAITNGVGEVIERYAYEVDGSVQVTDAFGNPRQTSIVGNDFTFTSALWEPGTGLMHMGARDYHPLLGRFLQPDPLGPIDGLNLYAYAGNDPVNFLDPTGLYKHATIDYISIESIGDMAMLTNLVVNNLMQYADRLATMDRQDAGQLVLDFLRGIGDTVTFGATKTAREWYWGPDASQVVFEGAYMAGSIMGDTILVSLAGAYVGAFVVDPIISAYGAARAARLARRAVRIQRARSVIANTMAKEFERIARSKYVMSNIRAQRAVRGSRTAQFIKYKDATKYTLEDFADAARLHGQTTGAAAEFRVGDKVYRYASSEGVVVNNQMLPIVMGNRGTQSAYHSYCAEIKCLNAALLDGKDVKGGTMRVINVGGKYAPHRSPKKACPSCRDAEDRLGVSEILE